MKLSSLLSYSLLLLPAACGGGGGSAALASGTTPVTVPVTPPITVPVTPPVTPPVVTTPAPPLTLAQKAAALSAQLGLGKHLLLGLGSTSVADINKQNLHIEIYDQYLNGVGSTAWPTWNSPSGAYVQVVAANAASLGAVPMFTLYQMASNGDGNLSGLNDPLFMAAYWANVRLLFQQIKIVGKPVLVNFEPDFWGYAQRLSSNADPSTVAAVVSSNPDCNTLSNDVKGVAQCLLQTARKYAPLAYVGFPTSLFPDLAGTALGFMQKLGADKADFIVMETLDRDAGCFEKSVQASYCQRSSSTPWYWDENNLSTPNFSQHLSLAQTYHQGLQLPLLWWQTPLGAPSVQPGGVANAWRDNRAHYFLTHAAELVAAGGFGAVFSAGESHQTTINSDGGQFKTLSSQYYTAPAALP